MATMESPPSLEEGVRDAHRGQAQHLGEQAGEGVLQLPGGARTPSSAAAKTGAGRARLSTLPLGVSGSRSSTTTVGTMWSGSRSAQYARSSAGSAAPTV